MLNDFGSARKLKEGKTSCKGYHKGTKSYSAPEKFNEEPGVNLYNCDLYSFGKVYQKIVPPDPTSTPEHFPEWLRNVLKEICDPDIPINDSRRQNATEILACFELCA
mmetsp:Transcript_11540/g.22695  ORF Transcript_11540/g.22695 Transcript_11540/m.22695 type:complete len:107 (+) Transcript_11540:1426-1746(+)